MSIATEGVPELDADQFSLSIQQIFNRVEDVCLEGNVLRDERDERPHILKTLKNDRGEMVALESVWSRRVDMFLWFPLSVVDRMVGDFVRDVEVFGGRAR